MTASGPWLHSALNFFLIRIDTCPNIHSVFVNNVRGQLSLKLLTTLVLTEPQRRVRKVCSGCSEVQDTYTSSWIPGIARECGSYGEEGYWYREQKLGLAWSWTRHTIPSVEITNKTQPCNRIYNSKIYWRLNMFRAAYRSSSRAPNFICSLWFIYPCGDWPLPWQQPVTTWVYKPEASCTV